MSELIPQDLLEDIDREACSTQWGLSKNLTYSESRLFRIIRMLLEHIDALGAEEEDSKEGGSK